MSKLMTNIRRVSLPLQESSQHLGRLLLSLGAAADATALDAEALASLEKTAAEAAAATPPPGEPTVDQQLPSSSSTPRDGRLASDAADTLATNKETRSGSVCTTASVTESGDPSLHDASAGSAQAASSPGPATMPGDNSNDDRKPSATGASSSSSSSSLMHASSPSIHSASSSHGRGTFSLSAHGKPPPVLSHDAAQASSPAPASMLPTPASPEVPRKPSPERPVAWRGFGGEADSDKLVICESRALAHLFTRIRNRDTPPQRFNFYAKRMMRILAEEGIACLESSRQFITTPTAATFSSIFVDESNVCVVSIMRAGDALAEAAQACIPHAPVGKILIQRNEESKDKHPVLYYKKFPPKISKMQVLLCDPMLATGGSALMAMRTLIEAGVKESAMVFITVVVCPEGLAALRAEFPEVTIVTGAVDDCLDERRFILPGLGDFGDRFFGTVP